MTAGIDVLQGVHAVARLFERSGRPVREKHGLTQTELDILAFLHNHPGQDTATAIVEVRMLPKANVSQAVESLIRKGLLTRAGDRRDRRRVHLSLTAAGAGVVPDILASRRALEEQLFETFTPAERAAYIDMNARILRSALRAIERK